jgi:hypothetical protein
MRLRPCHITLKRVISISRAINLKFYLASKRRFPHHDPLGSRSPLFWLSLVWAWLIFSLFCQVRGFSYSDAANAFFEGGWKCILRTRSANALVRGYWVEWLWWLVGFGFGKAKVARCILRDYKWTHVVGVLPDRLFNVAFTVGFGR